MGKVFKPCCEECKESMCCGYVVIEDDYEYYCGKGCLNKVYTNFEYNYKYEIGHAYWTCWN